MTEHTEPTSAWKRALQSPELRRVQLSWGLSKAALWGWTVTMNAFAFTQGGAWAVGICQSVHIIPGALATPVYAVLCDRWGPVRGLQGLAWLRVLGMVLTALAVVMDAPFTAILIFAAVEGLGSEPIDSVHVRILPWLARSPDELTAANSVTETLRMAGIMVGPAIGAFLLWIADADLAFCVWALVGLLGAFLLIGIGDRVPSEESSGISAIYENLKKGCQTLFGDRDIPFVVLLVTWVSVTMTAIQTYCTSYAMGELDMGPSGPSILVAAFGLGGIVGGVASFKLVGSERLALPILVSCAGLGVGTALIALLPSVGIIIAVNFAAGMQVLIFLVASTTLMHRGVPFKKQSAVFGINSLISSAALGVGGLLSSALITLVGLDLATILTGGFSILLAAIAVRGVTRFNQKVNANLQEIELVQKSPIFGMLPVGPMERVAAALERVDLIEDEAVIEQGDPGEHFFIVESGRLSVVVDGREVNQLGPGDAFGEIALLEDVPRTATVFARTKSTVYRLEREDFVAALNASPQCRQVADGLSQRRLRRGE